MKQFNVVLFFIIGLASCAPSEGAFQTALPTLIVTPSKTSESSQTSTKLPPTSTKTETPTLTQTFTPIPLDSFLLQEDFEDSKANGWFSWSADWSVKQEPICWTIEQEPNGNYYWSASCSITSAPLLEVWYGDKNLDWVDYAFESQIKFIDASHIIIYIHSDAGKAHYTVNIRHSGGVDFAQYNHSVGVEYESLGTVDSEPFIQNNWYTIRVEIAGKILRVYVNNSLIGAQELPSPLVNRQGGISYVIESGDKFYFDNIKVWSLK